MTPSSSTYSRLVRFVECGKTADPQAEGWRAYRGDEPEDEEPLVVVFCPECATGEFGGDNRAPNSLL